MAERDGDAEDPVKDLGYLPTVVSTRQPQNLHEAIDCANGAYGIALANPEGIDPLEAMRALKFFAYVGRFANDGVVGGRIRKTGLRQIEKWASAVRRLLSIGDPMIAERLGIDLEGLEVLESAAAGKRMDMSNSGGGGYRVTADGTGGRPRAALGRVVVEKRPGREIGASDVHRSVEERLFETLMVSLVRNPNEE